MTEEIEVKIKNMSLNEKPTIRFKFTPDLKEYSIKSKISDAEKKFFLPTPENLQTLFNFNAIKNQLFYDIEKYRSLLKTENGQDIIDFRNIQHIQNSNILNSVLFFLGEFI